MRLSTFIRENEERILQEWEEFAADLATSPASMTRSELRDHARSMLRIIVAQMDGAESDNADVSWSSLRRRNESPAEAHGGDRMAWGFGMNDMLAEFRALRVSVLSLWKEMEEEYDLEGVIRFNETMDKAIQQSIDSCTYEKEHEKHLLEAMLSWSADQSYIFDPDGRILFANRAMAQAYGRHPRDIIGKPVNALDEAFAEEVFRQIDEVMRTGREFRGDFTSNTGEGETHVIEYLFAPIRDEKNRIVAIAGNSRDITARKHWEHTLWKHANHDHLTGVPNRRLFLDRLEQDMHMADRNHGLLALLYIDLDKFKDANDRLGHDGGDQLLKEAANRIISCVRETDTVARMGGDEFTVLLVDAGDEAHVEAVARAILARLSRPFEIQGEVVRIAASVGIALYPEHGSDAETLTHNADLAMYDAKNNGGDSYGFWGPPQRSHAHILDFPRRPRSTP